MLQLTPVRGKLYQHPWQVVTSMIDLWDGLNALYHILIYNSVLKPQRTLMKSSARAPRTATKFAVKTAIDLTATMAHLKDIL